MNRLPFLFVGRRITRSLADALLSNGVDLLVVEGMGRAIHTNLDAKFTCDTLKVHFLASILVPIRFAATLSR